jgi:hypothetical protein
MARVMLSGPIRKEPAWWLAKRESREDAANLIRGEPTLRFASRNLLPEL